MTVGAYDKLQPAMPAVVPATRVHVAEVGTNLPVELVVKPTVPVGVVAPDDDVSVTVAVHVVDEFMVAVFGTQETLVLVEFSIAGVTLTVVLPWLPECVLSPPKAAETKSWPLPVGVRLTEQADSE